MIAMALRVSTSFDGSRAPAARSGFGIVLLCTAILLHGCIQAASVSSGLYVFELMTQATEWIGEPAGAPVWAPSGEAIAWGTEDGLYRRDLEDAVVIRLSTAAAAGRPAWSPDGRALAFVDRDNEALVVLDAETGGVQFSTPVMTRDAEHEPLDLPTLGGPAWSPDGSRLAFNCWDGEGDEICVVNHDGSNFQQVTHIEARKSASEPPAGARILAASNTGPPAWSPDGTALALGVYPEQRGAAAGVFVVDLEGGTAGRVSSLLATSEVIWFADGESLLFSATQHGRSDVLRTPVAGGESEILTAVLSGDARDPALSGRGKRLAVSSGGSIVIMDLKGNIEAATEPRLSQRLPAWSPQGDRIAYAAAPDVLSRYS